MRKEYFYKVLRSPHVTEKTMRLSVDNIYVFKVVGDKKMIKNAVEETYNVKVVSVRTLVYKPEVKMRQKGKSMTKRYKIAYVKLAEGHSIDFESSIEK